MMARITRFRKVVKAATAGRAAKIFSAGLRPAAIYGHEVNGVSPKEMRKLNATAAIALRPVARGRSLSATLLLHGNPNGQAAVACFVRYCAEAWAAAAHAKGCMSLGELTSCWMRSRAKAKTA